MSPSNYPLGSDRPSNEQCIVLYIYRSIALYCARRKAGFLPDG
jgi:hypothetical protein